MEGYGQVGRYIFGKIVKSSFKTKDIVSTSRPLELLHIDLFGPVSTASLYGSKYGLVIVDDYSRWTWVKFLRSKDNAYDVFSNFCTQIQSEKEMKILKVRSDHGGEFENEQFVQIYVDDIIFGSTNASLCKEFSKLL